MEFYWPPTPGGQKPCDYDEGRSLVEKLNIQNLARPFVTELDRWKIRGKNQFFRATFVTDGLAKFFIYNCSKRTVSFPNHMVADRQGSAAVLIQKSLNLLYLIQSSCLKQFNYSFSVRICNTTSEICEGEGQICTGIDRGKRSLDYSNDFYNSSESGSILPFISDSERDKRSPGDYIPLHEDTQQFISRGPILAYIKDDTGQGEFTVNSIFLDIGTIFKLIFMTMTHRI